MIRLIVIFATRTTLVYPTVHEAKTAECAVERTLFKSKTSNFSCRFNRWCREEKKCNGKINCPWLTPNDEANCSSCPKERPNRCACNKKGKMMCKGRGYVCYSNERMLMSFDFD